MNSFTYFFLFAFTVSYFLLLWLAHRQIEHIRAHREAVPEAFQETVSLEAHQKAADYSVAKSRLGKASTVLNAFLLLYFTIGGGINSSMDLWSGFSDSPIFFGVGMIFTVFFVASLAELPLDLFKTFVIEEQYGFNRSTTRQFFTDQCLQLVLITVIGLPMLALILWVMELGQYWWLLAWAIVVSFSLLISWIEPTLIAPLFNKFTSLEDDELKQRIESLLDRCGFQSKGIFVMDGSRRSGHGNAYFTGLGSNKRIVFFDTLIDSLNNDELEAVLAHELGHFKRKHVLKMLLASTFMMLVGFALLGWLIHEPWFFSGLGVAQMTNATGLLLFILVSPVFNPFMQPITAYVQRKFEFEADDYACANANATAMISALVKLYRENASTLTPDPLYSAFHDSHPPAAIRIAHIARSEG